MGKGTRWTKGQDDALLQMVSRGVHAREIAERLGRTESAVRARRTMLTGMTGTKHCKSWSASELNYLLTKAGTKSRKAIAEDLGRTEGSIRRKLEELGVRTRQGRHTLRGMARIFGINKGTMLRFRDRMGARWCKAGTGLLANDSDVVRAALWMLDPKNDVRADVTAAHLRRIIKEYG